MLVFTYFFLNSADLSVKSMKNAPSNPQTAPKMIAAGRSSIVFSISELISPNLIAPESERLSGLPSCNDYKIATVKHAIEVVVNTFHNIPKFQNVLGLEISYAKRAPPMGAPKATLTPAAPPAAIRFLL